MNWIDRAQAITEMQMKAQRVTVAYEAHGEGHVVFSNDVIRVSDATDALRNMPGLNPPSAPGYESCFDCVYSDDTEAECKARGCIHAAEPIKECYEPKHKLEDAPAKHETGRWIGYKTDEGDSWKRDDGSPVFMTCSECGTMVLNNGSPHWNYCPNCGLPMLEDEA